jgi:hypothetical protein
MDSGLEKQAERVDRIVAEIGNRRVRGSEQGSIGMTSESVGGWLGAIVGFAILVVAIAYGPIGQFGKPSKPVQTIEAPKAPVPATPAVRGPVVREVPQ